MGILIIILMVGSVFGVMFYGFSNDQSSFNYNGYKFKVLQNRFSTKIDGNQIYVYTHPEDIKNMNYSKEISDKLVSSQAFVMSFDPNDPNIQVIELLRVEISDLIAQGSIEKFIVPAMTNTSEEYNLPIITCKNATQTQPVILIKTSDSAQGSLEGNCIIFDTEFPTDILRVRDYLVLSLTGILE
jgi:hypothetical protein